MTSWQQFTVEAPEPAAAARDRFTATEHHVIVTLRRDV
jgi:hypothetical protein